MRVIGARRRRRRDGSSRVFRAPRGAPASPALRTAPLRRPTSTSSQWSSVIGVAATCSSRSSLSFAKHTHTQDNKMLWPQVLLVLFWAVRPFHCSGGGLFDEALLAETVGEAVRLGHQAEHHQNHHHPHHWPGKNHPHHHNKHGDHRKGIGKTTQTYGTLTKVLFRVALRNEIFLFIYICAERLLYTSAEAKHGTSTHVGKILEARHDCERLLLAGRRAKRFHFWAHTFLWGWHPHFLAFCHKIDFNHN